MAVLRSPAGCAWDRKQTHATLRPYLLEETYEAIDALDRGDLAEFCGELGDVLFQCVFHAQLASERGVFTITDVVDAIATKLVRRHPHVFTPAGRPLPMASKARRQASTPEAVKEQWARLKAKEQTTAGQPPRMLSGVPRALPALLRADKIGARVASVGFDWPDAPAVLDKVDEELRELRDALTQGPERTREELGDVLFSLASLARKLSIDPESALVEANDKFTRRFTSLEAWLEARGRSVHDSSAAELDAAWTAVKQAEAGPRSAPAIGGPSTKKRSRPARRSRR